MIPNDPTDRGLVRVRRKGATAGESLVSSSAFKDGAFPDLELIDDDGDDGPHLPPPFFDPTEHTITEVTTYLDHQDDEAERQRVLDLEAAGRARAGLTGPADQAVTDEP